MIMLNSGNEFSLNKAPPQVQARLSRLVGLNYILGGVDIVGLPQCTIADDPEVVVMDLFSFTEVTTLREALDKSPDRDYIARLQHSAEGNGRVVTLASGADIKMTAYRLGIRENKIIASGTMHQVGSDEFLLVSVPNGHWLAEKYNKT